jgi:hypothetical protein
MKGWANAMLQHFDGLISHAFFMPISEPFVLQNVSKDTPNDARHSPSPLRRMQLSVSILASSVVSLGPVIAPNTKSTTTRPNGTQSHHLVRGTLAPHFGQADASVLTSFPHSLHDERAIRCLS